MAGPRLAGERAAALRGGLRVDVLHDAGALAAFAPALERLAADAADANPFHEPWLLLPALRRFVPARLHCLLLRDAAGTVHGVLPLVLHRSARAGGLPVLETWRHPHAYDATPLVSRGRVDDCVRALLDWLASPASPCAVLDLPGLCGDTRFARSLQAALAGDPAWWHGEATYERAMYVAGSDAVERYPAHRRKELRRLWRRLAGRGALACRAIGPGDDACAWARRFLALEAAGWKGRRGTALATTGAGDFFIQVVADAHRRGRLWMLALELDGAPVAMQCNFVGGDGAHAFKVAYDERHADCSPGVQLELLAMERLQHGEPVLARVDSCARPDHALINRLWHGRRTIVRVRIAPRGSVQARLLALHDAARRLLSRRTGA